MNDLYVAWLPGTRPWFMHQHIMLLALFFGCGVCHRIKVDGITCRQKYTYRKEVHHIR